MSDIKFVTAEEFEATMARVAARRAKVASLTRRLKAAKSMADKIYLSRALSEARREEV